MCNPNRKDLNNPQKISNYNNLAINFANNVQVEFIFCILGYGHIAPKTELGRVITIFYATFGIPLTLLSITHVGGFMATVFRFFYKNIFCGLCCVCCRRMKSKSVARQASDEEKEVGGFAMPQRKLCSCWKKQLNNNDKPTSPTKESLLKQSEHMNASKPSRSSIATKRLRHSYKIMVQWRRGIHNALFTEDNKNIQVPIYVSLLLIGGYIALGALLFGLWEKEWNFLIGCYFCFITLSTIGFGDFVPGTSVDPSSSQEKLVLCSLYLIVGLALLAMCFDLMQEEARYVFRSFGKKLGLLPKEEMKLTADQNKLPQDSI